MKTLFALLSLTFTLNSFAIVMLTEDDVMTRLSADKVIQISKLAAAEIKDNACSQIFESKSTRAFVVKIGNQASLYATLERLDQLEFCRDL